MSACLVTRGDVDMQPIIDSLPYGEVLIWDNSKEDVDLKVFGRYEVTRRAKGEFIYWQDDDVLFTEHDALLDAYESATFVSNNAHGPNHGGYDDLALQAAGAIIPKWMVWDTWDRWWRRHPQPVRYMANLLKETGIKEGQARGGARRAYGLLYEADFIFGVLCKKWKQIDLPYTRLYADDNSRLCRQPWQEELKLEMTILAREIRDSA